MGELSAQVLKGFDVSAKKIVKEKAYYICDTADGLRMIRSTADTAEHIIFQHTIKEHVSEAGYPRTDRFYLCALTGLPYVLSGDERYVMTDFWDYREADFTNPDEFLLIVESVAHWHTCARHINFPATPSSDDLLPTFPIGNQSGISSSVDFFRKQGSALNTVKKKVSKQARLSDFDVMFIKNANSYAQQISDAAALLETTGYAACQERAQQENYICHNTLKEESLRVNDHDIYITQYADASIDYQLNDLCGLIRRYGQHENDPAVAGASIHQVLAVYNRIIPITQEEIKILYALLLYPYNFIKIVTQYYNKKRTWTPSAIINRMQAVVDQKAGFEKYIAELRGE